MPSQAASLLQHRAWKGPAGASVSTAAKVLALKRCTRQVCSVRWIAHRLPSGARVSATMRPAGRLAASAHGPLADGSRPALAAVSSALATSLPSRTSQVRRLGDRRRAWSGASVPVHATPMPTKVAPGV